MKHITTVVIVLGLLALLWSLWGGAWFGNLMPDEPRVVEAIVEDAPVEPEEPDPTMVSAAVERASAGAFWLLRVVGPDGVPCEGARLFREDGQRLLDPEWAVAIADSEGLIRLDQARLASEHPNVTVGAPGYRCRAVDLATLDLDLVHRVELLRGHTAVVEVVDPLGAPRPDVALQLSMTNLNGDDLGLDRAWPGSDPSTAVFSARSDAAGRATFHGMWNGSYEVQTVDPLHMVLGRTVTIVPPAAVQVIVGEVHGSVVQVDDEVLFNGLGYTANTMPIHYVTRSIQHGIATLAARFPGALVDAAWAAHGIHTGAAPATGHFKVFTRHGGWSEHTVPLRPISEIEEPYVLPIEKGEDQSAVLDLEFVQEDGVPLSVGWRLNLVKDTEDNLHRNRRVWYDRSGSGTLRLPPGVWSPTAVDGYIDRAMDGAPAVTVNAGERLPMRVVVPGRFRMARLQVLGPGLEGARTAKVDLYDERERLVQRVPNWALQERRMPVPIGKLIKLRVGVPGHAHRTVEVTVEDGEGDLLIPVELRPMVTAGGDR